MPKRKRSTSSETKEKDADLLRFETELEYVQCLANMEYLQHLAHDGTLDDFNFIKFLKYLHETWTRPEYARFLTFPHTLAYLRLLQESSFRKTLQNPKFVFDAKTQQELHFFHHKTAPVVDPET